MFGAVWYAVAVCPTALAAATSLADLRRAAAVTVRGVRATATAAVEFVVACGVVELWLTSTDVVATDDEPGLLEQVRKSQLVKVVSNDLVLA